MLKFNHAKLIRRDPAEMKKFRAWVMGGQPGEICEVVIVHEPNGSCCRREAWHQTARKIVEALQPATLQILADANPIPTPARV